MVCFQAEPGQRYSERQLGGPVDGRVERAEAKLVGIGVQRRLQEAPHQLLQAKAGVAHQAGQQVPPLAAPGRPHVPGRGLMVGRDGRSGEHRVAGRVEEHGEVVAGQVGHGDVVGHVHGQPGQRETRLRGGVAHLEDIAEDERDPETGPRRGPPAERQGHGQARVVHPVGQPPQAVARPDHLPPGERAAGHHALEQLGRIVIVADQRPVRAQMDRLRTAGDVRPVSGPRRGEQALPARARLRLGHGVEGQRQATRCW